MGSKAHRRMRISPAKRRVRTDLAATRRLRAQLGLTQEQYARLLGVTWTTVSRWERGQAVPDPKGAVKLARMRELVELIGDAIRREDLPRFLTAPHLELRGHSPVDLLDHCCPN
jgi:DNA-binding transcriptional regulator YiaG